MEFLRQVETELRDLSQECRKKYPMVYESSEKALMTDLRAIRESYAAAVRVDTAPGPGHELFRTSALLTPFVLLCNHTEVSGKNLIKCLTAIQRLVTWKAMDVSVDPGNILRILWRQATAFPSRAEDTRSKDKTSNVMVQNVRLKLLQTILLVLSAQEDFQHPSWSASEGWQTSLSIGFHLHRTGASVTESNTNSSGAQDVVQRTASTTLRQIVLMAFESEAVLILQDIPCKDAYGMFQDLCRICRGDSAASFTWLPKSGVTLSSREIGIELVEAILSHHPRLFRTAPKFTALLREQICPFVLSTLCESVDDFTYIVRVMRLCRVLLCEYADSLHPQMEAILPQLFDIISSTNCLNAKSDSASEWLTVDSSNSSNSGSTGKRRNDSVSISSSLTSAAGMLGNSASSPSTSLLTSLPKAENYVKWSVVLALEVLREFSENVRTLQSVFINHDLDAIIDSSTSSSSRLYSFMCKHLSSFVVNSTTNDYQNPNVKVFNALELLSEKVCVYVQPKYVAIRIALSALNGLVNALKIISGSEKPNTSTILNSPRRHSVVKMERSALQQMIRVTAIPSLRALGSTLSLSDDVSIVDTTLQIYTGLVCCSGLDTVRSYDVRDACVMALTHFALPSHPMDAPHKRHCLIIKAIFTVAGTFGCQKGFPWRQVAQVFQILDYVIHRSSVTNANEVVDYEMNQLGSTLQEFFHSQTTMFDESEETLVVFLTSLSDLSMEHAGLPPTSVSQKVQKQYVAVSHSPSKQSTITASRKLPDRLASKLASAEAVASSALGKESTNIDEDIKILTPFELNGGVIGGDMTGNASFQNYNRAAAAQGSISFCMKQFVEMSTKRVSSLCWELVSEHFVALSQYVDDSRVRAFHCESLIQITIAALTEKSLSVEKLLLPLKKLISDGSTTTPKDIYEKALYGLFDLIQSCGGQKSLQNSWQYVLSILSNVALCNTALDDNSVGGGQNQPVHIGFKSVRLLLDDYVEEAFSVKDIVSSLFPCLGAFALQRTDINISFTSIQELWTISDFIYKTFVSDKKVILWTALFQEFYRIIAEANDDEVRNCAITTFFRTAVTHGPHFDATLWELCVSTMLKMTTVHSSKDLETNVPKSNSRLGQERSKMMVHHHHNTSEKRRNETLVLLLHGMKRVMKIALAAASSSSSSSWFEPAWNNILRIASMDDYDSEVIVACVETIQDMVLMSSQDGHLEGTTVVQAGARVVDGALVASSSKSSTKTVKSDNSNLDQGFYNSAFNAYEALYNKHIEKYDMSSSSNWKDVAKCLVNGLTLVYNNCYNAEMKSVENTKRVFTMFSNMLTTQVGSCDLALGTVAFSVLEAYRQCTVTTHAEVYVTLLVKLSSYVALEDEQYFKPYFFRDVLSTILVIMSKEGRFHPVIKADAYVRILRHCNVMLQTVELTPNVIEASFSTSLSSNEKRIALELHLHAANVICRLIETISNVTEKVLWETLFSIVEAYFICKKSSVRIEENSDAQVQLLNAFVTLCSSSTSAEESVGKRLVTLLSFGIRNTDDDDRVLRNPKLAEAFVSELNEVANSDNDNDGALSNAREILLKSYRDVLYRLIRQNDSTALSALKDMGGSSVNLFKNKGAIIDHHHHALLKELYTLLCEGITSENSDVRAVVQSFFTSAEFI